MPEITSLTDTTELEAVNEILAAVGESAIAALGSGQPDEVMAVSRLRGEVRQLQTQSWRFNTEYDFQIAPASEDFSYTDPDSTAVDIDVWEVPTGLADWRISPIPDQVGSKHIDLIPRISQQYTSGGLPVMVFYDRDYNRDGTPSADDRDYLWIDAVWYYDFLHLPEVARRLCIIRAARRFAASVVGDARLVQFTQQDERDALQNFYQTQALQDKMNVLNHPERRQFLGGRPKPRFTRGWRKNERW